MIFNNKVPDWGNGGTEPPESLKKDGFNAGYKPPAAYFNWFFNRIQKAVKELQEKLVTELKGLAFKDTVSDADIVDVSAGKIEQDETHRFVSDTEKNSWNKKASTLDKDMLIYVATTGNDTTGDGSSAAPYKTITYALSKVPKNLSGYVATINVADGTYNESVIINGFTNGYLRLQRNGTQALNTSCNITSIKAEYCDSLIMSGFNITSTTVDSIYVYRCNYANISFCQSITMPTGGNTNSFNFEHVSNGLIDGCRSLNHPICLKLYSSRVHSTNWSSDSEAMTLGIYADVGSTVTKGGGYQPNGTFPEDKVNGSIIVNQFGAKIGTLSSNTTLYVATTGSDTTGNGTSENPFKTIQHAVDILPKDLGGNAAAVSIADGTYDERVYINGFHSGTLYIQSRDHYGILNTLCNVTYVQVVNSLAYILINGLNITNITTGGIDVFDSTIVGIHYVTCTGSATSNAAVYIKNSRVNVTDCKLSNHVYGIAADNISNVWASANTGVNNNIGIQSEFGASVHLTNNFLLPLKQVSGGTIFNENGTQISGVISSGLSCTWGTLAGGYIRHGNISGGAAMVTITVRVTTTSVLSANTQYNIGGFPLLYGVAATAVANNMSTQLISFLGNSGGIGIRPMVNIAVGDSIELNVTYLTNS